MPTRTIEKMSRRLYQPGTFGPFDEPIDDDIIRVVVTADRAVWDTLTVVEVVRWVVEISYDGGPFVPVGVFPLDGGEFIGDTGKTYLLSKWSFTVPPGVNRVLRATITIHEKLRTDLVIDLLAE